MLYIMSKNEKTLLYLLGMDQFADLAQAHWRELSQWIMDGPRQCRSGSSWIVTRSISLATVDSWTTASISPTRMPCAQRPVSVFNAMKSACEASSHTIGFVQKSVTRHKDAYTNSEKVFMSTVAQQPVSILEAQTRTPIREPCETARCPNEEKGRA